MAEVKELNEDEKQVEEKSDLEILELELKRIEYAHAKCLGAIEYIKKSEAKNKKKDE